MSTLHDQLYAELAVPTLMEGHGTADVSGTAGPITYKEEFADDVELTGIIGNARTVEADAASGRSKETVRSLTISTDSSSDWGGVAAPKQSAIVVINDVEWSVRSVNAQGNLARLELVRIGSVERARADYRNTQR